MRCNDFANSLLNPMTIAKPGNDRISFHHDIQSGVLTMFSRTCRNHPHPHEVQTAQPSSMFCDDLLAFSYTLVNARSVDLLIVPLQYWTLCADMKLARTDSWQHASEACRSPTAPSTLSHTVSPSLSFLLWQISSMYCLYSCPSTFMLLLVLLICGVH